MIQNCSQLHPYCLKPQSLPLPRRVIQVGHREACLYETRGESQAYAILSHCWQNSKPLKTVETNLARHQGRLPGMC
ncbi:hypothetical protein EJ08DRAFT_705999 [Tothia fuscella]|uniref:Uncharacterized protein n=1 Tax=Tothia fuscella TaxID=1048955 RepID=A0A9P4NFR2_9PEZI|nr:hypothetical protein EJ08DRAFT_705999 [Tothia fuscella]